MESHKIRWTALSQLLGTLQVLKGRWKLPPAAMPLRINVLLLLRLDPYNEHKSREKQVVRAFKKPFSCLNGKNAFFELQACHRCHVRYHEFSKIPIYLKSVLVEQWPEANLESPMQLM